MCGIVGYSGPKCPKDIILSGLKTLEYRGYDSAGVSILHQGNFKRIRAEGKLTNLEQKLSNENFDGHVGIGHTRWATHGPPNERNAHPHVVAGVSIVHNGIIENYAELRSSLIKAGAMFESDTDSELVAHLISNALKEKSDFLSAVLSILPQLQGAYSIVCVSSDHPDQMIAFKNGPPLVLGSTADAVVVASDVQAILPHTQDVIYLDDDDIVFTDKKSIQFYSRTGEKIEKKSVRIEWSPDQVEKQGFAHFMLKEIYEQPRAVAMAIEPHIDMKDLSTQLDKVGFGCESLEQRDKVDREVDWEETQRILIDCQRVFIVACGTSYYAGMAGEYMIERLAGIPVEVDTASEFRYRHPVIPDHSLVIFISQSGESADTLAALRMVNNLPGDIRTLSICNVKSSSIDRESNGHLYMNAGVEIAVASTKAFVSTLSVMSLIAISAAKAKKRLPRDKEKTLLDQLIASPSQMEKVLNYDKFFKEAADDLKKFKGFLYMGRGIHFPIALEGALKLKELAYMHAEGYAAGEMKHGPLALVDQDMAIVMLAPDGELFDKTLSNLEEAKARSGQIISIGTGDNKSLKSLSHHYLGLPESNWMFYPLLEVIPLQLLAYHVAESLGNDVDQPRNLAKSVTVE